MSFSVNSNIDALRAYNALAKVNAQTTKAQLRIATQKRINSVADDTSGFAVGKSLDQKVQLMKSAQNNVGSAKDMLATAESQLTSVKDLITSIRAKIADSTNPATDNTKVAGDIKSLAAEIANIFATTKFNDTQLLVSSAAMSSGTTFSFQTGSDASDKLNINYMADLSGSTTATVGGTSAAGVSADVSDSLNGIESLVASTASSTTIGALSTNLDTFEDAIDGALSTIGNYQQRLDIKNDFLTTAIANSASSVGRLFDANIAEEQLNATRGSIAGQVASSMLSQLNMAPQNVLSLFR